MKRHRGGTHMICSKCGAPVPEGSKFCTECGEPLQAEPVTAEPETPAVCPNCGNPIAPNTKFCVVCGTPLGQPQPAAQPLPQNEEAPQPASVPDNEVPPVSINPERRPEPANLKEYAEAYASENTKKTIRSIPTFLYILAALNLLLAFFGSSSIVDAIALAALGYWYQKTWSTAAAYAILAYAILSVLLCLVYYGELHGLLILILGIYCAVTTAKVKKAYDAYKKTGSVQQ